MSAFKPRVISLSKHEGKSFGFFLRVEQGEEGHLIRCLETGGPAELAGLKDGDRVLRVNGTFVDSLKHPQVVDLVKKSGMSVTFHVLDEASYKKAKANGVDLSSPQSTATPSQIQPTMNGMAVSSPKPKLCFLVKGSSDYGFSLRSTKGEQGMYMSDVAPGGVADKAGVKNNDRVLEVNSENVENCTHEQIVDKIKASGSSVMLLLVDEDMDKYCKTKKLKLGANLATVKHLPHKPCIADIKKGSDGYGYYLREEPSMKGHFINDIDRGSPAENAGLKNMDRLVAVNGEEVDSLRHDEVVDKIRSCGNKCSLLVVDAETDKMYKMGGVSPLLYWEEMRTSLPQDSKTAVDLPTNEFPSAQPLATPTPSAVPATKQYQPKLCTLCKTASGYGFHLNGIQGVAVQYIKEVVKGGSADQAGLQDEDIVIEVNGVNVETSAHEDVVSKIRAGGNQLVLLVVSRQAYDYFKARKISITPDLLEEGADVGKPAACVAPLLVEREVESNGPATVAETRSRTTSSSSSSSNFDSEDERL